MKFKYILFDADNTLLDFGAAERQAFFVTAEEFGVAPTEEHLALYSGINDALWKQIEKGEVTNAEMQRLRFTRFLEAAGAPGDGMKMNEAYVRNLSLGSQTLPGAFEAVENAKREHTVAIITNGIPAVQRSRYAKSGLDVLFGENLFISGELGADKPSVAYFDEVCVRLGIEDRSEALVVGDSLTSDILGGNRAGIPTCWLSFGKPIPEKAAAKPDYIIEDVRGLAALLEEIEK